MKEALKVILIAFMACILIACANLPSGPSVMALPSSGKTFDQFRIEEQECRHYAYEQVGGTTPRRAMQISGLESSAIGAGLGALAGLAFGGGSGEGAAIGAGAGLLGGGLMGSGSASTSASAAQQRYDNSYIQCMYAKGHRVPISGKIMDEPPATNRERPSSPSPHFSPPPPPPGNPPPPPLSQ